MAESELDRARAEYGSTASPYSALQDYLINRPVFDRGVRAAPTAPTLRTLDFADDAAQNQAANFRDLIQQQETTQREEREAALQSLREALQQETSSGLAAQAAERSEVVKALEDRLAGVKESIATESEALRDLGLQERADIRQQQQTLVDQLQRNIDTAKSELAESQARVSEAQTTALGDLEDRQGSLISDLTTRISGLNDDLGTISSEIRADLAEQEATLSDDQKAAGDLLQARIDSLTTELGAVSDSVKTETAAQTELLRGEREQLVSQLEGQIGSLKDDIGALPIDEIQNRIADITSQSQDFVATASTERAELAEQIAALEAAGITQQDLEAALQGRATTEDLEKFRGDYEATGRLVQEALQTGQKSRESLDQRIRELQAAQIDPDSITGLQSQITALQGQTPQEIDVDALRQQITDQIMAQIGQQQGAETTTGTTTGAVPGTTTGAGSNMAADMNVSDGVADRMGYFEEPERNIYGTMPTTEGAAEMGATPFVDNAGIAGLVDVPAIPDAMLADVQSRGTVGPGMVPPPAVKPPRGEPIKVPIKQPPLPIFAPETIDIPGIPDEILRDIQSRGTVGPGTVPAPVGKMPRGDIVKVPIKQPPLPLPDIRPMPVRTPMPMPMPMPGGLPVGMENPRRRLR